MARVACRGQELAHALVLERILLLLLLLLLRLATALAGGGHSRRLNIMVLSVLVRVCSRGGLLLLLHSGCGKPRVVLSLAQRMWLLLVMVSRSRGPRGSGRGVSSGVKWVLVGLPVGAGAVGLGAAE